MSGFEVRPASLADVAARLRAVAGDLTRARLESGGARCSTGPDYGHERLAAAAGTFLTRWDAALNALGVRTEGYATLAGEAAANYTATDQAAVPAPSPAPAPTPSP